ncbi:hypothetical protein QNE44_004237 [Vibrio harveyi]|uniref:hypothetical protein n=1 Tax=Vibrio harveyi TaxID=669 RepID=UPI0023F9D56E|nr:hypothetical protein [Vibrio harveyi]ELV8724073.1 hypothetical protein [Vibrio harveyi]MDF6014442.1 hypothetical protein [Vibrio harveyi]
MKFFLVFTGILLLTGCASSDSASSGHLSPALETSYSKPPTFYEPLSVDETFESQPDEPEPLKTPPKTKSQPVDYRETIKFVNAEVKIETNQPRIPLNGLYTKITLQNRLIGTDCKDPNCKSELINYDKRNAIARFFSSKRVAVSASANINVQAYSASVPLLTITEISSSEIGESWERMKVYTKGDEPLFLVPSSVTSGSLILTFRGSEDKKLDSSKALDVAIGAVGILAPSSQLLTSLNKQSVSDKAKAIDSAIAKSFSESLVESVVVDLTLDSWHPNDTYQLTMNLPKDKTDWGAKNSDMAKVGIWTLKFDAPRVSAFYPVFICLNEKSKPNCVRNYTEARDSVYQQFLSRRDYFRILDASLYQINDSDKISVGNIISELDSVKRLNDSSYINVFNQKALDRNKLADINQACSDISRKSAQLGLSTIDSSLIVYSTFMASSLVKVPALDWEKNLASLSACNLGVELLNATNK